MRLCLFSFLFQPVNTFKANFTHRFANRTNWSRADRSGKELDCVSHSSFWQIIISCQTSLICSFGQGRVLFSAPTVWQGHVFQFLSGKGVNNCSMPWLPVSAFRLGRAVQGQKVREVASIQKVLKIRPVWLYISRSDLSARVYLFDFSLNEDLHPLSPRRLL